MQLNKIIQRDYTSFSLDYQIKLPLDLEISIPSDDPVRLVSAFVEEMDLSELYKTYGRIRKNQATPRQMLKLVIYAAMNRIYSSRDIRKACKRDINFMYLLEGMPTPDHATIARFISLHFSACAKVLLAQMSDLLYLLGEISGKTIFIDGTKIESAANQYTFVWKRAITKNQARLYCWVSVKQFSKNDTATACQDWLRSTRLGRGSIKSHVRTVKVLGMGLFAFQERIHLWKGVTH